MASSPESDWYAVLGVDPHASDEEIGRAFRAMARRHHPDAGPDPSQSRFSDVARAWEVLRDPSRRAAYDRRRSGLRTAGVRIPVRRWAAGPSHAPTVDSNTDQSGDGLTEVEVSVTFAEAVTGTVTKVALPQTVVCPECAGSGRRTPGACNACGGQGRYQRQSGSIAITHVCSSCGGTGARPAEECGSCAGRGWRQHRRELTVKVPPGVAEGTRLRLRWPADGRPAGLARVRIQPDEWFSRKGADIVLRLPLNVAEAVLGCSVTALLPDGPVDIVVPAGTQPGDVIRVPGRGVPATQPGALVATAEIVWPRDPGPEERAALEALAAASPDPRRGWPAAAPSAGGPQRDGRQDGESQTRNGESQTRGGEAGGRQGDGTGAQAGRERCESEQAAT